MNEENKAWVEEATKTVESLVEKDEWRKGDVIEHPNIEPSERKALRTAETVLKRLANYYARRGMHDDAQAYRYGAALCFSAKTLKAPTKET